MQGMHEFRVKCEICDAAIDLMTVNMRGDNSAAIDRQQLNELLVDYDWLPTSRGRYCPKHAGEARAKFRPPR
jgi:hypothetical protein